VTVGSRDLLVVACSARKKESKTPLPAIEMYDGPAYRLLRRRLIGSDSSPAIWILSAKHGLLWSDSHIYHYDERLTKESTRHIRTDIETFVRRWGPEGRFDSMFVWAGKEYLDLLPKEFLAQSNVHVATGGIGEKLRTLKQWCDAWQQDSSECRQGGLAPRTHTRKPRRLDKGPLNYFIPDWDDYLDPEYDFVNDRLSWQSGEKVRLYAHEYFGRDALYDGILVSLGHIFMKKGFARNGLKPDVGVSSVRRHLHLKQHHLLMGDCGAFSYRRLAVPPFETDEAIRLYNALRVDIGASIDHIPFGEVDEHGKLRSLSTAEIEGRIELTAKLARDFVYSSRATARFVPMGVIQARTPDEYALMAREYIRMGYDYIALGGLVRRRDDDILRIVEATTSAVSQVSPVSHPEIRVHLFGVLREGLLAHLLKLGVASFDSGSYLRKAWLRSDKNYLSPSDKWYSAIRVPYSNDPRFRKNATENGISFSELRKLEQECLRLLREHERTRDGLSGVLDRIVEYDSLLLRTSDTNDLRGKYETTLTDAPWKECECQACRSLGIDIVVFRGFNRNKRRGFHNTRMFYKRLLELRKTS